MDARRPPRTHGFTLGELVLALVLVGILAALAGPRLMGSQGFASRGFYDEAQAVVRYAQKTAIAWRSTIYVCVLAGEIRVITNNDCNAPVWVKHPVSGADLKAQAPTGVSLSPTGSFSFDSRGRPSGTSTITIDVTSTITGDPARQILVATETGYVYR